MISFSVAAKRAISLIVVFILAAVLSSTFATVNIYAAGQTKGTVTVKYLNVRSAPGTDKKLLDVIGKGSTVTIVQTKNGWHKIALGNQKYGWVSADYIKKSSGKTVAADTKQVKKSSLTVTEDKKQTASEKTNGTVTVIGLYTNLRKGAGTDQVIIKKVYFGTSGKILQKNGDWYKIKLSDAKVGWVNKRFVKVSGYKENAKSSNAKETQSNRITVKSSTVNVREEASLSSKIIGKLRKNEVYKYSAVTNGWYKIVTPTGKTGYVSKDYVTKFKSYAIQGDGDYVWPTQTAKRITNYFRKGEGKHKGIDIAAPGGSQIMAVADGKVHRKVYSPNGMGHLIVIKQNDGLYAYYAHMQKESFLKEGDKVKAGDTIGVVGSTGHSTGNHLHLEFRRGSERFDPLTFYPAFAR